jgi:hypothetical protein
VWHEPLPLELARERQPLVRLLDAALKAAGVSTDPSSTPIASRVLLAPRAALAICVNETPEDARRQLRVDGALFELPVRAYGARMALIDRRERTVLAATPGEPITRA